MIEDDLKKLSQEDMIDALKKAAGIIAEIKRDTELLCHIILYLLEKDYNGKKLIPIFEIQALFNGSNKLLLTPDGENMEVLLIPSKEKLQ